MMSPCAVYVQHLSTSKPHTAHASAAQRGDQSRNNSSAQQAATCVRSNSCLAGPGLHPLWISQPGQHGCQQPQAAAHAPVPGSAPQQDGQEAGQCRRVQGLWGACQPAEVWTGPSGGACADTPDLQVCHAWSRHVQNGRHPGADCPVVPSPLQCTLSWTGRACSGLLAVQQAL